MPESSVGPVAELPSYQSLNKEEPKYLKQTVMLKLNGGLGTGMGLEQAKSLLDLKAGDTFLDFIAKQVMLMNSFATSADTLDYLSKYPELPVGLPLEFVQN